MKSLAEEIPGFGEFLDGLAKHLEGADPIGWAALVAESERFNAARTGSALVMRATKPILFSGPMVRALLAGSKTQTRRTVKPQPFGSTTINQDCVTSEFGYHWYTADDRGDPTIEHWKALKCPYGVPGDLLIVREAHYLTDNGDNETVVYAVDEAGVQEHLAESDKMAASFPGPQWVAHKILRPSIHMPRWASRLTLEITDVRVERLQDITADDADAECFGGMFPGQVLPDLFPGPVDRWAHLSIPECYGRLWESINGPGSWAANPWCWAVSFEVHHQNVDAFLGAS